VRKEDAKGNLSGLACVIDDYKFKRGK